MSKIKGAKNIQWRKDSLFNKWCWVNSTATCKKNETRPLSHTVHKNSSKWIKDLNVRPENHITPKIGRASCRERV